MENNTCLLYTSNNGRAVCDGGRLCDRGGRRFKLLRDPECGAGSDQSGENFEPAEEITEEELSMLVRG